MTSFKMLVPNKFILFFVMNSIFSLALLSCGGKPEFSKKPTIEFRELLINPSIDNRSDLCSIKIFLKDGDGDLGLSLDVPSDKLPPFNLDTINPNKYYNNYFLNLYTWKSGSYKPFVFPVPNFNLEGRFSRLSTKSSPIEGFLSFVAPAFPHDFFAPNTQAIFTLFVYDRALNQSNTITTTSFILNKK